MKSRFFNKGLEKTITMMIVLFLLSNAGGESQVSAQHLGRVTASITIPDEFSLEKIYPGVELYKKDNVGGAPDYVQVVNLAKGASVVLQHGEISDAGIGDGFYGGDSPTFQRQSIQDSWNEFSSAYDNPVCVTNGAFFSPTINPTPLAFPLKVTRNGETNIYEGYGTDGETGLEIYPGQKLMLEIWSDRVNIKPLLTRDDLYSSNAPNIIAGLTEYANKEITNNTGRTFIGIADSNNDGTYETILIFNSLLATQPYAAEVLRSFSENDVKVMMLDGGGSTQLFCGDELYIASSDNPDRTLPQTLAVQSAPIDTSVVDVSLIIDSSGSMSWNDPYNKRLDAAKAYLTGSYYGDYVGVVDFDSDARLASPLRRIPDFKDLLIDAINTIDSYGGTNIGVGVATACEALQASPSDNFIKGAILLTDGVGAFANEHQCFIDRHWPIYTFGFGGADVDLLTWIAVETGGDYTWLPTSDLICEFQRVRAKIADVEPEPCEVYHVGPLEITIFTIIVEEGQEQITISISWTGSDVELSLISPSGRIIDRNTSDPDVVHDLGSTYEIYTILNPEPGESQVSLYGADVPIDGEDVVFGFTSIPSASQPPTITVPSQQTVQYSDLLNFQISATDPDDLAETLVFTAAGVPDGIGFTDNGDGTATVSGIAALSPGTYDVEISVTDPEGLSDSATVPINVVQEDSRTTYTGPMLVSTPCTDCTTATVPLRATIQDITAVLGDPAFDEYPGDITHATVTFINRETNAVLCSAPVTLFDALDPTTGTAYCEWVADIGANDGYDFNLGILVDGYYIRNTTADDVIVVVSKPSTNSITGGGYLLNGSTSGTYAGDLDLRTHFGFNIKFINNRGRGQSIVGRATVIVRQDGHIYRIRTNALESLAVVPASNDTPAVGEFYSKASIEDVTDPNNPILLTTQAFINFTMTDYEEASGQYRDLLGITVWGRNGELLYSSNWTGTQTIEQAIEAGNLEIHQFTSQPR